MKLGKTEQLTSSPSCPSCTTLLDGVTGIDHEHSPEIDDLTVCSFCMDILKFDKDMALVKLTPFEIDVLPKKMLYAVLDAKKAASMLREFREERAKAK